MIINKVRMSAPYTAHAHDGFSATSNTGGYTKSRTINVNTELSATDEHNVIHPKQ